MLVRLVRLVKGFLELEGEGCLVGFILFIFN